MAVDYIQCVISYSYMYVTGFMKTVPNRTLEVTILNILKHHNQPRIVSTWKKLTQKADHFTVFESFPNTSCRSQKFPLNKIEKFGWLDMWGSIRDVYIGFVVGDGLGYSSKFYVVGTVGHYWSPKPTWMGGAGSLMAEMKQNLHSYTNTVDVWTAKTSSNAGHGQPRHLPSAWNHYLSLSHHCEFTSATISLE